MKVETLSLWTTDRSFIYCKCCFFTRRQGKGKSL